MIFDRFFQQHPAFLYALAAFLGVSSALSFSWVLLFPTAILFLQRSWKRILLTFVILISFYAYVVMQIKLPKEEVSGIAHFSITDIVSKKTSFGNQWLYRGTLISLEEYRNIPCIISISKKENRPLGNCDYLIQGHLKITEKGNFSFSTDKKIPWKPVNGSWSFAEWRLHAKNKVKEIISEKITDSRSATFLQGLATGNFDDPMMQLEFSRFGLQHIMAISGFHFAIIAAILSGMMSWFIPHKRANLLLIFLLSTYFLFLGESPSIIRAWIMIVIALLAVILEKKPFGINSLGVSVLVILLYNPMLSLGIGFQFSVLTTASILLCYPLCSSWLKGRSLSQMIQMPRLDQHGYLILATARDALALAFAVNISALPMTLFCFQTFPYLSLIYNLFFPFLVSISMLFLIIGLILGPLGGPVHAVNTFYTKNTLNFIYNMPDSVDYKLETNVITAEIVIIYLTVLFVITVFLHHKKEEELRDLQFV